MFQIFVYILSILGVRSCILKSSGKKSRSSRHDRGRGRNGCIGGAEGVAIVLDEPEVVRFHEIHDSIEMVLFDESKDLGA